MGCLSAAFYKQEYFARVRNADNLSAEDSTLLQIGV